MKRRKVIGLVLLVGIVVMVSLQFFPVKYNHSTIVPSTDFVKTYNVPSNIAQILQTSCYNCHSNNTIYPWYNKVQPVGWFLENHINDAKKALNFSEFGSYPSKEQQGKLSAMINMVEKGKMPLPAYTFMHHDARLTKEKKSAFLDYLKTLEK